jgi:hypothetical protein
VLTLLDTANQLVHQLLATEVPQHPHSVQSCRDGAWSSATSAICSTISRSRLPFCSTSAAVNWPNGSQESRRIRDGRQARLTRTCDSLSESLRRHLIDREVAGELQLSAIWVICYTEKVATCVEMISLKARSAAERLPYSNQRLPRTTKRTVSHYRRTVLSHPQPVVSSASNCCRTFPRLAARKKPGRSELPGHSLGNFYRSASKLFASRCRGKVHANRALGVAASLMILRKVGVEFPPKWPRLPRFLAKKPTNSLDYA